MTKTIAETEALVDQIAVTAQAILDDDQTGAFRQVFGAALDAGEAMVLKLALEWVAKDLVSATVMRGMMREVQAAKVKLKERLQCP